jgi:hypothetical protein
VKRARYQDDGKVDRRKAAAISEWQYFQRPCHINDDAIENKAKAILNKAA